MVVRPLGRLAFTKVSKLQRRFTDTWACITGTAPQRMMILIMSFFFWTKAWPASSLAKAMGNVWGQTGVADHCFRSLEQRGALLLEDGDGIAEDFDSHVCEGDGQ